MKVAFDEHVPLALVRMFQGFASETQFKYLASGLDITSAKDHAPKIGDADFVPGSDSPWITRFSKIEGKVIISGDRKMLSVPHERLALIDEKMIVIFLGNKWSRMRFFQKCARLLNWWPNIVNTAKEARSPSFWMVPNAWEVSDRKLISISIDDPKAKIVERRKIVSKKIW